VLVAQVVGALADGPAAAHRRIGAPQAQPILEEEVAEVKVMEMGTQEMVVMEVLA
jgi:hypothetical protein